MKDVIKEYLIPDGMKPQDVKDSIHVQRRLAEEPAATIARRYYDSFDWAVYLAGAAVEERLDGERHLLVWHDLRVDTPALEQEIAAEPGFARDLPPGPVRERLEPVVPLRRLLPLIEVRSAVHTLRLLNDDEKTVARLILEEDRYIDAARGREGPLASRLRLVPVKGYEDDLRETAQMLDRDMDLAPACAPLLLDALAAAGRRPADYSSQLNYHLDPNKRADASTKEILLGLLDTIEANVAGTKANLDPEFLHDLRVAVRRTRSALTQIKAVLSPDAVEDFKGRFSWLQEITGPVRDLDVYLLDFASYRDKLPHALQSHLEPLREFLLAHYDESQKALVKDLDSTRFRATIRDWRAFLESPVPERSAVANAMRPTKAVADECIWRMYRRVHKEGRAIVGDSPPEELHEMRKSCKKLRYLIEFFDSLYPPREIRDSIKLLKVLLDNLGGFQDLAVQAGNMRHIAQRMRDEGRGGTDTLLAMGVLVGDLLIRQQEARVKFAEIFATFDGKQNQDRYSALFAPATKGKKHS